MTNQEFFDLSVNGLRAQGQKSGVANAQRLGGFACLYRDPAGRKCAVGLAIPDDQYQPEMENAGPVACLVYQHTIPALQGVTVQLLSEMQSAHDCQLPVGVLSDVDMLSWEEEIKEIAILWELVYTPPGTPCNSSVPVV